MIVPRTVKKYTQAVTLSLDNENVLMCEAALLLRKGKDIPPEKREQAIKHIQVILGLQGAFASPT